MRRGGNRQFVASSSSGILSGFALGEYVQAQTLGTELTPFSHLFHLLAFAFSESSCALVVDPDLAEVAEFGESLSDLCEVGRLDLDPRPTEEDTLMVGRQLLCRGSGSVAFPEGREEWSGEHDLR